ncbi:MAG: hypothetical protein Q7K42_00335 [Candidatus Diapherotrites archaeon]|nr:hypothetical protein [Candidatus Diapherotrites archaeon]
MIYKNVYKNNSLGLVEMAGNFLFLCSGILTLLFLVMSFTSEVFIIPFIILGAYTYSIRN